VLSDVSEPAAPPSATRPLAWRGGAATTKAVVGVSAMAEGGVAKFTRANSPGGTVDSAGAAETGEESKDGAQACNWPVETRFLAETRGEEVMAPMDVEACLKNLAQPRGRACASHRRR